MNHYRQWHELSSSRLQQERDILNALPYFRLERAGNDTDGRFTANIRGKIRVQTRRGFRVVPLLDLKICHQQRERRILRIPRG